VTLKPVVDFKSIARNYLRTWFWLDLLAVFPFWGFDALLGDIEN